MGSKGLSHLINVGVGTDNNVVITTGVGEKVIGLWEFGGKEFEQGNGYTGAQRDPYPGMKKGRERSKVVSATGCMPFKVGR